MNKEVTGDANGQEPQSTIRGVALASFLQLMQMEKKTCTLSLRAGQDQGRIFMAGGEVINAETGSPSAPAESGHNAFRRIMTWQMPAIDLIERVEKVTRVIHLPLMHLLMESQQQIDESTEPPLATSSPGTGSTAAEKLGERLAASAGVTAYAVTGPDGTAVSDPGGGLDIAPEQLTAMGDRLAALLGSRFKSLKINLGDNASYWAGRITGLDVRVRLKPGYRPGKMTD